MKPAVEVVLDREADPGPALDEALIIRCLEGVLQICHGELGAARELYVRTVSPQEMQALNRQYRSQDKPTNVLSFPFELPPGVSLAQLCGEDVPTLGDLILCPEVIQSEASEQGKAEQAHWMHMLVHGILHLLGYDHVLEQEAEQMEAMERDILAHLGIADPYHV